MSPWSSSSEGRAALVSSRWCCYLGLLLLLQLPSVHARSSSRSAGRRTPFTAFAQTTFARDTTPAMPQRTTSAPMVEVRDGFGSSRNCRSEHLKC
ncbi:unnamed protein product [Ectocarpus sp. 6 AP-2014]